MTESDDSELASAFDEDTSQVVQTIMLMRIYDMLTVIARALSPAEADVIYKGHSIGKVFGPAPAFDMGDEVSETDEDDVQ